jgi:tetratricopeptide (TPR) repeat protein
VPTENLAAYQAYLLGKQRLTKLSPAALNEAVDYFQQAIGLDADFALAYVGLAEGLIWLSEASDQPPAELLARAQAATDKALALDDQLGEAYSALAGIKLEMDDLEGAEAASQRALELNPNYATAHLDYGTILMSNNLGRPEEALELFKKAVELDPLSTAAINYVGYSLLTLGRFEEALPWWEKALEIDPADAMSHMGIGDYYHLALGQLDEATVWYAKALSLDPRNSFIYPSMGWLLLDLGDPDHAEFWIERSIDLGPDLFWSNVSMQLLHLYRGDEASARAYGEKAFALWPRDWPELALLRDYELKNERYAEARTLYEETYPELLNEDDPKVVGRNWNEAIDLALVLSKMGEQKHADLLLERSARHIQHMSRRGVAYALADVQIYALQGEKHKALAALRRAVDGGWRSLWWHFLGHNLNLESLHDEPEYQAIVAEIEADMADPIITGLPATPPQPFDNEKRCSLAWGLIPARLPFDRRATYRT